MKAPLAMALVAPLLVTANGPRGPGGNGFGWGGPWGGFGCGSDDQGCGFWGEGGCASSCFSSFWATATPTPTAFCDSKSNLEPCVSSACGSDSKFTSYSSRRSSLCNEFSSCSSTGTYTYTYKTPDGLWSDHWGSKTWPTGEVVVTGCPWNGDGWGFPFWGGLGYGPDFWDNMGPGWAHTTITTTVTSASAKSVVTLEQAVSGDTTTFRTLGAQETQATKTPNAAPTGGLNGVKVMGAALGAVVVGVGML